MNSPQQTPDDVSTALRLLAESLNEEEKRIRNEGSKAMNEGDYDTATAVIDFAKRLLTFQKKVAGLEKEWDDLEDLRDKATPAVQEIVSKRFFGRSKRGDGRSVRHERRRDETAEGRHTRAETAATKTENARRADIANKVRSDTRTATCAGMRAQHHRAMAQHQEAVTCVWFRSGRRKTKRRKASAN